MIDFSTLKELTIPEGNVTQITDASGNVLWKQAPSGATIALIGDTGYGGHWGLTTSYAEYNGTKYLAPEIIEAAIGDTILFRCAGAPNGCNIYLNGNRVATGADANYSYTVSGDAEVDIQLQGSGYTSSYHMYITEL